MFRGLRVLAIVPARGGSKGVPRKNIYPIHGKPLIAYTGELLQQLGFIDLAIVSTDDAEIAEAARAAGLEAPFLRPSELSGDTIGDTDVLRHGLAEAERISGSRFDVVLMLQPTCPLRKPAHVTATLGKLVDEGWDSVWTVSTTDLKYHPLKQLVVGPDGRMEYFDPAGSGITARQQLQPLYHRNGACYAFTRDCLMARGIKGERSAALVIDDPLISIDTLEDLRQVALQLGKNPL
ncbi:MAG: acylneuraminate cytidylyltransferase family protein [Gemmatimonadales bacterium]|nr:acylneuraminate cytidylyltransferase family protein [Gemmatimonadales bacterium]